MDFSIPINTKMLGSSIIYFKESPVTISIWASSRENLSSGFPTKPVSKQSPQVQRLAGKWKFHL